MKENEGQEKKQNDNKNTYYSFSSSQSFSNINGKHTTSMSQYENRNGKVNQAAMEKYDDGKNSIIKQHLNGKEKYLSNGKEVNKDEFDKKLNEFDKTSGKKMLPANIELEDDVYLDDLSNDFDTAFNGWLNDIGDFGKIFNRIGGDIFNSYKRNGANYLTDGGEKTLMEENERLKKRIAELEKMIDELQNRPLNNQGLLSSKIAEEAKSQKL